MPTRKAEDLTVSIRTVVAVMIMIASTVLTGAGVYYGLQSKLETLTEKVAALEQQNAAQSRALLELTVTLKVKGVVGQ